MHNTVHQVEISCALFEMPVALYLAKLYSTSDKVHRAALGERRSGVGAFCQLQTRQNDTLEPVYNCE